MSGARATPRIKGTADGEVTRRVDADRRYYYGQDRNWNVVTLYESDDGVGTAGRVREYYAYTPYGEFTVLGGDAGSGLQISAGGVSGVGNALLHQGLWFDAEKGSYQNRWREYAPDRFVQRDPLTTVELRHWRYYIGSPRGCCASCGQVDQGISGWAPATEAGAGYQDGMNLYGRARSNPVVALDPSGLWTPWPPWGPTRPPYRHGNDVNGFTCDYCRERWRSRTYCLIFTEYEPQCQCWSLQNVTGPCPPVGPGKSYCQKSLMAS
ncbi:MAG: hypothetical protein PVJ57_22845 [Phycisphaerae bacterium]